MGDFRQEILESNCTGNTTCYADENVTITVNITDECGIGIGDAAIYINNSHESFTVNCTPVYNNGSGIYTTAHGTYQAPMGETITSRCGATGAI